jgi:Tol biopolymer transport system component
VAFVQAIFPRAIKVLNVATKTLSSWSVNGNNPAWSPDGTQIAYYNAGSVMVVRADGSTPRPITVAAGRFYADAPMGWTSDGKYILARVANGFYDLIDVQTGAFLPLLYSTGQIATLSP